MDAAAKSLPSTVDQPVVVLTDASGELLGRAQEWLVDRAAAGVAYLGARGEVRVRVVKDPEMAAAHMEYLEIEGTTDVLTFDMSEPAADGTPLLDVDILACFDEAARQGAARGHGAERELLLYVIHGVLHCLGYDDHDDEQSAAMHAREDEILRALGVGATFAPGTGGSGGDA